MSFAFHWKGVTWTVTHEPWGVEIVRTAPEEEPRGYIFRRGDVMAEPFLALVAHHERILGMRSPVQNGTHIQFEDRSEATAV